eukprot:scaffold14524_cov81-Isochrysis_galbana.AAC.2
MRAPASGLASAPPPPPPPLPPLPPPPGPPPPPTLPVAAATAAAATVSAAMAGVSAPPNRPKWRRAAAAAAVEKAASRGTPTSHNGRRIKPAWAKGGEGRAWRRAGWRVHVASPTQPLAEGARKKKEVNRGGMVELFKQPKRAAIKPLGAKAGGCCNGTKS